MFLDGSPVNFHRVLGFQNKSQHWTGALVRLQSTPADVTHWIENDSCKGCIWLLQGQAESLRQCNRKGWGCALAYVDHPCIWQSSFASACCFYLKGHKSPCNNIYLLLITLMMAFDPTLMALRHARSLILMVTIPYTIILVHWGVNLYCDDDKCSKRLQRVCCGDSIQDHSDYSTPQQPHLYIANSGL